MVDDQVVDVPASAPAEGETAEAGFYRPPAKAPHTLSPRKRRLARLEAEAEAFFAVTAEGGPTQAREAAAAAAPPTRPAVPSPRPAAPLATPPARSAGRYRAAIAERVVQSWREIPHFAVQREVDAGEADSCLAALRQRDGGATFTDLLLRAYALAIADVVESDGGDVGLAVATPEGVMMPVVQGVPALDASGLVTRRTAAVRRGREGKLAPHDLTSTPVGSLSNLGARGVDSFTGIIPVNQRMLLTVGRVAARPVVVDGRLAVRTTLIATLNVDHRSLDGDQAALVLSAFDTRARRTARLGRGRAEMSDLVTSPDVRSPRLRRPAGDGSPSTGELLEWLDQMLVIRQFEHESVRLSFANKIPGGIHSSEGQEAVAVGTHPRPGAGRPGLRHPPQPPPRAGQGPDARDR